MDFKIDENLPIEVADLLRQVGHDAVTIAEKFVATIETTVEAADR